MSTASVTYDTVILAGGRGSRLAHGGKVDKAAAPLHGQPLVTSALKAAQDGRHCVVVGATAAPLPFDVRLVEDPIPDAGPAYALHTGLQALPQSAEWVLVLSCDIPGAADGVRILREALVTCASNVDGVIARDDEGRQQWLLGFYRAAVLNRAVANIGPHDSLRRAMDSLNLSEIPMPKTMTKDVDTPEDLAWWETNHR